MHFELAFHPDALAEWHKLDAAVRTQLKKRLAEPLINPRVPAAQLFNRRDRYKMKLRAVGYHLVYQVLDAQSMVLVVAVGKHDRDAVYKASCAAP